MMHPLERRRLYRSWTAPAGRIDVDPVIDPDERDGPTLEEQEMAERDREQQELEDEPA